MHLPWQTLKNKKMKRILILQMRPEDEAADSEFEAILRVGELDRQDVHRIRLERPKIPDFSLANYNAIIAGGSPFDVSCPSTEKSNTQKRIESFYLKLFDEVVPDDFPFFGACSGNSLLGNYAGSSISGRYSESVGPVEIQITGDGLKDPLLMDLPRNFIALAGHKEACDVLPRGATLLATSKTCPVQMFRIKSNIYATQFHPEADAEEFLLRMNIYKNHNYYAPEEADKLKRALQNIDTSVSNKILYKFVSRYRFTHR